MSSTHHASICIHPFPKAVLFDAVGTVIRPEPSVAAAYAMAGRREGIDVAESDMKPRFAAAMARQDEIDRQKHGGRTNQQREIERWRGIVTDVFGDVPEAGPIFDDLWEHFARPEHWRLFDDAAPTWNALAEAGVTLGIASNFDDRLDGICAALAPLADCPHVFVSSRVGWRKPRPEFFATVADKLGLSASEILLVGDDLNNDYRAARAAGWQAVLIDRKGTGADTFREHSRSEDAGRIISLGALNELFTAG
ncbi:MAG TPA: HAD-IA family hydrolase [Pirellulales bacterium]